MVSQVRKAKFDFVIDLHSYYETNLLGFFPARLTGFTRAARQIVRSISSPTSNRSPRKNHETTHLVDRYLDLLKPLGIQNPARTPVLKTSAADDFAVEALLKKEKAQSGELLVGLFPGAGNTQPASGRWNTLPSLRIT